jgi:transposase InsO family protein
MASLPDFPPFNVHEDANAGPRWKKWLTRFERLLCGLNITADKRKTALLLHYAGPDVDDIYDTLPTATGSNEDYRAVVEKLNQYFSPQTNVAFEVFNFRQAKQKPDESLDSYHTRLRHLSQTCEFSDPAKEIKDHIISTCTSNSLRRRALRDNLDLPNLLKTGRAIEISERQARQVEQQEFSNVNSLRDGIPQHPNKEATGRPRSRFENPRLRNFRDAEPSRGKETCRNCGGTYPHIRVCPARGKDCKSCGKVGHFARVCRTNPPSSQHVQNVTHTPPQPPPDSDSEPDYVFTIANLSGQPTTPKCYVNIAGHSVPVMIDSGASVNILDDVTYNKITHNKGIRLQKTNHKIYSYGSSRPLPIKGTIITNISTDSKHLSGPFHVVGGNSGNLLSCTTACQLDLLKITINNNTYHSPSTTEYPPEFECLFSGIGKLRGKTVKLHIDPDVSPKQQPHRRIPFHVRSDVEKELQRLEDLDIIEKVDGPTPWISPIVVVPKKSGEVRICIDMREANRAVKREKHLMPTIDDLVADLNGATVFTTLDLSSGYHQLELAEESRHITTFSTHLGLRRYKRLLFGINAASEIFQNTIEELLTGLPGCKNISDDIIVFGKDQATHDANLHQVLDRLKSHNLRLNKAKCHFSKSEVMFYGHIFSADGLRPDQRKVEAIQLATPPRNPSEVKSLLGMAQYLSRYIPGYANITAPLRALTKEDVPWQWKKAEQAALDRLKQALTGNQVMSYFDPHQTTQVIVDASPVGLGALLVQNDKVICYASRVLSDVETRYSQTEKEMLAVVWAVEHFHLYLYGAPFTILTDHQPLLGIFRSHKPTSARIDRWKLRLMPYNYHLVYQPGKDEKNPADFLSRHPNSSEAQRECADEEYINYICANAIPTAMTLQEIQLETSVDETMQMVIQAIETNNWSNPPLPEYKKVSDELLVHKGLVLRGNRIVMPTSLRRRTVNLAHIGHQGIVKTKRLLRSKVWFPNIDKMVEETIQNCLPCQAATSGNHPPPDPLHMTHLPSAPWKEVATDFLGPFPTGEYLLVVIDEFSRFPEVEVLTTVSAKAVLPKLDAIFSRQGIPDVLKSDNGPPFNGTEFESYAKHCGFTHRKITPYWPQANGEAERFMRTLQKSIRAAIIEKRNWKQAMNQFLLNYRATPHSTTSISPSESLNSRKIKTMLPEMPSTSKPQQKSMAERDAQKKDQMKSCADNSRGAKENCLQPGDIVLLKQPKKNKLTAPYNPEPFVVEKKKGTMVTAKNDSKTVTRNSSQFKVISSKAAKHDDKKVEPKVAQSSKTGEEKAPQRRPKRNPKQPARFADYT